MNDLVPPEFSRSFALNTIGATPRAVTISATAAECAALAARFDLAAISKLEASAKLVASGEDVSCTGALRAALVQHCAATDAPVPAKLKTGFAIRFVAPAAGRSPAEEIEIALEDIDIVEHDGAAIDLGEVVAQTLLLALDPFPRAKNAAERLKAAGVIAEDDVLSGAFAGLKDLLKKP